MLLLKLALEGLGGEGGCATMLWPWSSIHLLVGPLDKFAIYEAIDWCERCTPSSFSFSQYKFIISHKIRRTKLDTSKIDIPISIQLDVMGINNVLTLLYVENIGESQNTGLFSFFFCFLFQ